MIRLSAFLCLILAFVSGETVLGQAYINAPQNVCVSGNNQLFTTVSANVSGETVTDIRWTITPGILGLDYKVLYGKVNTVVPGHQSLTVIILKPNNYTVSATMSTPSGPYSASQVINAQSCPLPDCKGPDVSASKAGFLENFGTASIRTVLDPAKVSTQYTANTTGTLLPGEYCVFSATNDPGTPADPGRVLNPDWVDTRDHTRQTDGAMLIVNADAAQNIFYSRRVNGLCKGAQYNVSASLKNLDSQNFFENGCGANYTNPSVVFEILNAATNGVIATFNSNEISPQMSTALDSGWQTVSFNFKTVAGVSDVIVRLRNGSTGTCGNNIAIDDISFSYCTPFIYSFFDGQTDQLGGEYIMCAGSPTNLTSAYTPKGYFNTPHYFWQYSKDSISWTTINGDGDGVSGTDTDVLHFAEGSVLLEGDTIKIDTIFFRLQIFEDGNDESCAAPSVPITVTLLPNPKVKVADNQICLGDTANLVATGGFDRYEWDSPINLTDSAVQVWPTETSIYTVTGYKTYGFQGTRTCSRTGQAIVIVDDKPIVEITTATPDSICLGTQVDLKVDDNLALYDVLWTPTGGTTTELQDIPATPGPVDYTVTVTSGVCVVSDTQHIEVLDIPTANAGVDTIRQCNDGNFTMNATLGAGETGKWTISGPANGAIITNDADPMTPITGLGGGQTVTLVWSVHKTLITTCVSTDSIVLMNVTAPISSVAGPDQQQCGIADIFTMAANTPPAGATGTWDVKQGTVTGINDINTPNTTVTVTGIQDVMLTWTVSNATCAGKPDTVILHKTNPPAMVLGIIPDACSKAATFTIPYTSVSDNPLRYDVRAAATNAMPGFTAVTDLTITPDTLQVPCPIGVPQGTYDFILTVKNDGAGCSTDIPFSVPVASVTVLPASITVDKPETCAGSTVMLTVQGGTLGTGANWVWYQDACGGASIGSGPSISATITKTTSFFVRAETVGACGNTECVSTTVTLVDKPPVTTFVPGALTVDCEAGKDYTTLFGAPIFDHTPFNVIPVTVTFADANTTAGCTQQITRTWTATDDCGFTATASQTITVVDKKAPVFTTPKPADITVNCDALPAAANMEAMDNCAGLLTVTPVETREAIPGECNLNYKLTRTWTATDPCGNSTTMVQVIFVKEITPPAFTTPVPADVTVDCGNLPTPVNMTATESCTGNVIAATYTDTRQNLGGNGCTYQVLRTWSATDPCGNTSTVTQTITVQDTTRPAFTVLPPARRHRELRRYSRACKRCCRYG